MDWKYMNLFVCLNLQISLCCIPAPSNKPTTTTMIPVEQTTTTTATEDLCRTEGSPNPDEPCVFPFNYNRRDYNECKLFSGRYWCGLQYTYDKDRWGYCREEDCPPTKEIPEEETTKTTTTTSPPETTTPVTTTPVTTTPVTEVERGHTNLTVRDGEQGYFCDVEFDYKLDQTFQLITDLLVDCNPSSNLKDSKSFLELNKFQIQTSKGVDLDCSLNAIFSNDKPGSIEVPEKAVEKSLSCNASTEVCLTNNGSVYPAKCAQTFRYEGREYHGCTDKEMEENDERLWCATLVDGDNNAVSGQWGYCSSKCSFCSGSPITRQIQSRPCGYDCLVNPGKPMKGSVGSTDVPLLSPSASIVGKKEANFIKEVRGQIQLNIGNQVIRLICPNSKFFDPSLIQENIVYALCGPKQYRFTVYSEAGELLHQDFKNDRFGCDPCPKPYKFVTGYMSTTHESYIVTSLQVLDGDECEDRCYQTNACRSFSYSQKEETCKLFSSVITKPTLSFIIGDEILCVRDNGVSEMIEEFRKKTSEISTRATPEEDELDQLMQSREYQDQRDKYQEAAFNFLAKSIAAKDAYRTSTAGLQNHVFYVSRLDRVVLGVNEHIHLFCGKLSEGYYVVNLPDVGRLRHVVHEMAFLMLKYGRYNYNQGGIRKSRLYIRVDHFVHEILLEKEDHLYDNPVGCYYKDFPQDTPGLTKTECEGIVENYNKLRKSSKPGLEYREFKGIFQRNNNKVFAALKKLFMTEHEDKPEEAIEDYNNLYYYHVTAQEKFETFLAEKLAMAIFVETVRNIEMLPVLLELLRLSELTTGPNFMQNTFFTDFHPMTQKATFLHNKRHYEITGGIKMHGVGFFPIWNSIDDFFRKEDWNWEGFWDLDAWKTNWLTATLSIHKRSQDILPTTSTTNLTAFYFMDNLDDEDAVRLGRGGPVVTKNWLIRRVFSDELSFFFL